MPQRLTAAAAAPRRCPFCDAPRPRRPVAPDEDCARCTGPLYPAERRRLDYSGQRMLERHPREQAVRIVAAWPETQALAAEMHDLSLNGMRLAMRAPLEPNQVVRIDAKVCRAIARVAYCREAPGSGFTVGVEFLTLAFAASTGSFVSTEA